MRQTTVLTVIRVFIGLVFLTYGLVKVLGGQFDYGPWVMDKATVDGPSLVWAFYGYSPVYGRATGLFELLPAIMILIPRTATIGAAALFAVSLNITIMDFAYHYPAVKYFALLYTTLLAGLLWADRHKLALLLETNDRARAALARIASGEVGQRPPMRRGARQLLLAGAGLFLLGAGNLLASSLSGFPTDRARQQVERSHPGAMVKLLTTRATGLIGLRWESLMTFAVKTPGRVDTMTVHARKITGFLPWQIDSTPAR